MSKLKPSQVAMIATLTAGGATQSQVAKVVGCADGTVSKVLKRLRQEEPDPEWVVVTRPPRRKLKPCGTNAAYQRHRRRGEKCTLCWAAHAEEIRLWKLGQSPSQLRKKYRSTAGGAEQKSA